MMMRYRWKFFVRHLLFSLIHLCVVKLKEHAVENLLISSAYTSLKPTIKCKEPIQILFLWLNASLNAHNCSVKKRLDDVYHGFWL